jgi:D-glycero-alpha-D-manno-heptose 1-phosphate guanylyltransferase
MNSFDRYGTVEVNDEGIVMSFKEKSFKESGLINGGIYLLKTDLMLEADLPERFSFEIDIMEKQVSSGGIMAIPFDNYFIDIGVPEDFYKAQKELPSYL